MSCSVLGMKGFGHTIELQGQTSKCMFGTATPCMTSLRMGYFAVGVFMESSHAPYTRQLCSSFG